MIAPSQARRRTMTAWATAIVRRAVEASLRAVREELQSATGSGERSVQIARVLEVETDDEGVTWADVECSPTALTLTVRCANATRSTTDRPRVGDEVVILIPRGDLYGCGVLLCGLPTNERPGPALTGTSHWVVETDADIRMHADELARVESGSRIEIDTNGELDIRGDSVSLASTGGDVSIIAVGGGVDVAAGHFNVSAASIAIGGGGKAIARASDPLSVTIPGSAIAWLNAVGALPGGPGAFPVSTLIGTITSGNPSVTA